MPRSIVKSCLVFLVLLPAAGQNLSAGERLAAGIAAVIAEPEFKHAHWGILVSDLATGEVIYELNADKLFAPASVTKLYSVAAALDVLGPDFRFETPVYRRGDVEAGVLTGDLILVASSDPTLGGRTTPDGQIAFTNHDHIYANGGDKGELTGPDPLAGLDDLARQVAAAGVKRVRGDVFIDDRLFERASGTGSGPRSLTPIAVNDNLIDLVITPGEPGAPASVSWRPRTAALHVDARVETVGPGEEISVSLAASGENGLVVRGKIPAGHKPLLRVHEVPDAVRFARALFIEALERAGVVVEASPLGAGPDATRLPAAGEYGRLTRVAQLTSPPFSEAARLILKVSHNLHASTLPLLLAARHGRRTLAEGLQVQHDVLARLGVDVETISFGGGAGGASADFVTPRATVQLLTAIHGRPYAPVYRRGLPVLGVDGTLAESVSADSRARGQAFAKTGTLFWDNVMNRRPLLTSKALAGYLQTAQGRELAFALFVNNVHLAKPADTANAGRTLGRLCELVHEHE